MHELIINLTADLGRYIPGPNLVPDVKRIGRKESLKYQMESNHIRGWGFQYLACGRQVASKTHLACIYLKDDDPK